MKFTNGQWLLRDGATAHYANRAYDVQQQDNALEVLAPTRPIRHRGDTLGGPCLTLRIWSPMPGVIGVRMRHFEQESTPSFELNEGLAEPVQIAVNDDAAELASGPLAARVQRGDGWSIEFIANGRCLTANPAKGAAIMEVEGQGRFTTAQLALGVGELVYGLGERFTPFVKNGQCVETWNEDGGTASEQAYKCIPFYLTNRSYGVFVNHPGRVSFEVASEKTSVVQFSVPGEELEYFVLYGPTPKEILDRYTALTGRPALPPAWSFGLWLSTSFTTDYDEETVTGFVDEMAKREIPLSVFHFDCFWMRAFRWCDFEWDPEVFPDPPGMLKRLKDKGLRISAWINPYIAQASPLFQEAREYGFLLERQDGTVWQWDLWQPGMGIVDFTNEAAREWFQEKLDAILDDGVDALKTDFGERIPTDVFWSDGSDPDRMHNLYPLLYNRTVHELLERKRGAGDAVVFARSATAGGQKYPVHWGGDCWSTFESMAESLRGGLSLGLSGFGFWSHDIGGFEGTPPPEVFKRWVAFGLLSSHSRLHGSSSYRVPWAFDEEAVDVLRHFTKLKCRLMPYLWSKAVEAREQGTPMLRAMMLEFPDDPGCEHLDRQYMLGDSLMVAPVFSFDGSVSYYLPAGCWTHLLMGKEADGGSWRRETHDFMSLPLWVRPNTILATGATDTRPDYDFADGVTLEVYGLESRSACGVYDASGALAFEAVATRDGHTIRLAAEGATKPFRWLLVGFDSIKSVQNAAMEQTERGIVLMPSSSPSTSGRLGTGSAGFSRRNDDWTEIVVEVNA